MSVIYKFNF